MTCAHCGMPWEPTGHWCAIQPDPAPEDPALAALRDEVAQLRARQRLTDWRSIKDLIAAELDAREQEQP